MSRKRREEDVARELHEHRDDPEEWSEEAVEATVRPARTAVVSCRFPLDEIEALEQAARTAQESISEYVRNAVKLRQIGGLPNASVQATPGGAYSVQLQIRTNTTVGSIWSDAPSSSAQRVPEYGAIATKS